MISQSPSINSFIHSFIHSFVQLSTMELKNNSTIQLHHQSQPFTFLFLSLYFPERAQQVYTTLYEWSGERRKPSAKTITVGIIMRWWLSAFRKGWLAPLETLIWLVSHYLVSQWPLDSALNALSCQKFSWAFWSTVTIFQEQVKVFKKETPVMVPGKDQWCICQTSWGHVASLNGAKSIMDDYLDME